MNIKTAFKIATKILKRIVCPFQPPKITQTPQQKLRAQAYRVKKEQRLNAMRVIKGLQPRTLAPRRTLIWPTAALA